MKKSKKPVIALLILVIVIGTIGLSASSCENGENKSTKQEDTVRQSNYDKLVESQPTHTMNYSPTRATKNFWIDTWGQPGKLAYVYLMASDGSLIGYYIFEGLPVSYATSLVPPYQILHDMNVGGHYSDMMVAGPSVDGTYASTANVNTMYGKDAVSGMYIEYTVGMGINALVYSEPMPLQGRPEPPPLGAATLETAKDIE
ncbi:MAG: hypothetical protein LBL08_03885 [Candidatus Nomurabacteria bacterium]|jgi:hypothetical protein|nr:hypothetical protein [Candidatus Nomurabacteria bacterium]